MQYSHHCEHLLERLNKQREAGFLCDCTIVIGEFQFKAHRNVLASFKISSITGNIALNQQTCLLTLRDYNNQEKPDAPSTDPIQPPAAKATLEKKSAQVKKRKKTFSSQKTPPDKSEECPNDVTENSSVEMFLDANKLATEITEQAAQGGENSELQLTPVVESETFTAQEVLSQEILVQAMPVKPKRGKAQQSCALKEHCLSNIASDKNSVQLESLGEELDPKYPKAKPACNTCGKVFSEASSLRRHMRIHKGVKPYVCQLCGKAFTQCNQLKTHVRTHTGEKPYKCELCDKGFAQKCQLVFHSRMHHGEEKPYKCDACNLQFATSSNLKIHARKHSGEKPYVCDRCGQRFAQASTLTYHVRRHTGEKPYVCDTCGKAFAVSSSLITHSRKHTGEKPYICGICGKSFISSGELSKHFRSHTGERPFICELCGNSYTDIKNLKKHKAKVHADSENPLEPITIDNSFNDQDSIPNEKSPLLESTDVKPSDIALPLPIGSEDHQVLLPITESQSPPSDTLLRSAITGYSEPQYIFLQQLY
ncbi:myoneurin isoform X2 [Eublepharis macularius]|uniref:Myoneurin n=1 Tax=Eublepharis macularius TaxID=481883 RepID=A0AA97JKT0_EUBMA|nr:myoneurin isoform X2 [Eublepharis macularius]